MSHVLSPELYARELLHRLKIDELPVPVDDICNKLGISLRYNSELDAESLIVKTQDKTIIVVKETNYKSQARFCIAHESGHYTIPTHLDQTYKCTLSDLFLYTPDKPTEIQANQFAAELLMPSKYFEHDIREKELTLTNIISLADKYETSLISTSLRFINKTEDLGAIVLAKEKQIEWVVHSSNFRGYISSKCPLDVCSTAYDFFEFGVAPPQSPRKVDSYIWSDKFEGPYLIEETIAMPTFGLTLSVIRPTAEYVENNYDAFYDV